MQPRDESSRRRTREQGAQAERPAAGKGHADGDPGRGAERSRHDGRAMRSPARLLVVPCGYEPAGEGPGQAASAGDRPAASPRRTDRPPGYLVFSRRPVRVQALAVAAGAVPEAAV